MISIIRDGQRSYFDNEDIDLILTELGARQSKGEMMWKERVLLALQGIDVSLETLANGKKDDADKTRADNLARDFIDRFDPSTLESAD